MSLPTPAAKLFAVINKWLSDNSKPTINPSDYTNLYPRAYSGVLFQRNTLLHLDPPLSSTITGRTSVFYDRIDMSTITGLSVEKGAATSFVELLPKINEVIGFQFTTSDFNNVDSIPLSGSMSITASPNNLLYTGTFTFNLATG